MGKAGSLPPQKVKSRFGIAEWYGHPIEALTPSQRKEFAAEELKVKQDRSVKPCPFRGTPTRRPPCNKPGGVCSLRLYQFDTTSGVTSIMSHAQPVTVCPNRFKQADLIYKWIGKSILNSESPVVLGEIPFLEKPDLGGGESETLDEVGRIDNILVAPGVEPMSWCALEVQAVYFQGTGMRGEYEAMFASNREDLVFPVGRRQPDFRSSGPKRLMPQLQIKVPTLRRWGKKLGVVVDEAFFEALGRMQEVKHVSNCDVAWFVLRYDNIASGLQLTSSRVVLTTLEQAVEGLTAGIPTNLNTFEDRIRLKLRALQSS